MARHGGRLLVAGVLIALFGAMPIFAQLVDVFEQADALRDDERPRESLAVLEPYRATPRGADRAEVLWRMAAATLMHGEQRRDAGAPETEVLGLFEEGEALGRAAMEADPNNPLGYYWTSSNIGRWGETRGVLNSLFRAPEMRDLLTEAVTRDPDHADSYFVLGQLYARVPGIVSFGNVEYAVSLARRSVDLMDAEVASGERDEASESFYIQLASHLIDRNWNQRRRERGQSSQRTAYNRASTSIDRGFTYEGVATIPAADDRREAATILREVISRLERVSDPRPSDTRNLTQARELLGGL